MRSQITIDASNFAAMANDLARRFAANGLTFSKVIDSETAAVISAAAKRTREAKAATIRRNVQSSIPKASDSAARKNSFYTPPGGGSVKRGWKISDARWKKYLSEKKADERARLRSRGLSRQTWLTIGDQLGLQLKEDGLRRARNAVSRNGRMVRQRASGTRQSDPRKYTLTLEYSNPIGRFAGARNALQKAINGRVGFFNQNLRTGALDNAKSTALKYPGLRIQ